MATYFRFQPKGCRLIGHTSQGSSESLHPGYVFAYDAGCPYLALEWFDATAGTEVVMFEGDREYDPGDAEGIAVRPTRELERISVAAWLVRAATHDPRNGAAYRRCREMMR